MSKNSANNLWLVIGSWSLGVMVSGIIFFTIFNKPAEKFDDVRNDLRVVKVAILVLVSILIMGGFYVGFQ